MPALAEDYDVFDDYDEAATPQPATLPTAAPRTAAELRAEPEPLSEAEIEYRATWRDSPEWQAARREANRDARDIRDSIHAAGDDITHYIAARGLNAYDPAATRLAKLFGYGENWHSTSERRDADRERAFQRSSARTRQADLLAAQQAAREPVVGQVAADAPNGAVAATDASCEPVTPPPSRNAAAVALLQVINADLDAATDADVDDVDLPPGLNEIICHALDAHQRRLRAQREATAARKAARLAEDALRAALDRVRRDIETAVAAPAPAPWQPTDADFLPILQRGAAYYSAAAKLYPQAVPGLQRAWAWETRTARRWFALYMECGDTFESAGDKWLLAARNAADRATKGLGLGQ